MRDELVTVVVPIYNVEKYLDRCINSIVGQTYSNLEIILVDDGSPDNCPRMCDEWAGRDSRIKVIHKKNAGLGMARNTGIENATGSYICFFDSDDYIATDTIERSVELAVRERADTVIFGFYNVGIDGNIVSALVPKTGTQVFAGDAVRDVLLPDMIYSGSRDTVISGILFSACTCLFSMELINRTGWRFVSERAVISEDSYSLMVLYAAVERAAIIPDSFYYYCANEASLTRTYRADRYEKCAHFYRESMKLADKNGYGNKIRSRIGELFISFVIASLKQIVASDSGIAMQYRMVSEILNDETLRGVLWARKVTDISRNRNIIIAFMKKRLAGITWMLAKLQSLKG